MNPQFSVYKNLLSLKGIGPSTVKILLSSLGISNFTKFQDLPPFKVDILLHTLSSLKKSPSLQAYNLIPQSLFIEKLLQKQLLDNITRLKSNYSYRGGRLSFGYPVRGQRTRSNAKNSKKLKFSNI